MRIVLLLMVASSLPAQLVVKLSPQTVAEFDKYVATVEGQLNARWQNKDGFLPSRVGTVEAEVHQMNTGPVAISQGLIHDWVGTVFIPQTTPERVVSILEDFDHHKDIYPEISQSKTLSRNGNTVTGSWLLDQKGLPPIKLDVIENASYEQVFPGKWKGAAYARKIIEIDTGLFSRGRRFPLGEGHGYLWRLYGYWTIEALNGGVLAECRTLSLSRDIPPGLAWAVRPYVEKQPRESLTATLTNTRKAAAR